MNADGSSKPTSRVRYLGSVINFSHGFGFIKPDDLGPNVFLHYTEVVGAGSLDNGDIVEFERCLAKPGEKADRALKVRLARVRIAPGSSSSSSTSGGGGSSSCCSSSSSSATMTASHGAADAPSGSSSCKRSMTTLPRAAGGGAKGLVPRSVARGVKVKTRPRTDKEARGEHDAAEAAGQRAAAKRARPAEAAVLGWM